LHKFDKTEKARSREASATVIFLYNLAHFYDNNSLYNHE